MATGIYESVLFELNQCRSNPSKYSNKLSATLKYYKGKTFEKPGRPAWETFEGPENVQSCIKYLKTVRPAAPLEWSEALYKAAQAHVDDIGPLGLMGHESSDGLDADKRIEKYGNWAGQLGENIDYGNSEGEDIVISLLIDDGVLARGQRLNIMKREHAFVGIGFGYHSEHEYICVIVFAEVIIEHPESGLFVKGKNEKETKNEKKNEKEKKIEKETQNFRNKSSNLNNPKKHGFERFDFRDYQRENLNEDLLEMKNLFDSVDFDESGSILMQDIKNAIDQDLSYSDIFNQICDWDDAEKIDFDEFIEIVYQNTSLQDSQITENPGKSAKPNTKKEKKPDPNPVISAKKDSKPSSNSKNLKEETKTPNPLKTYENLSILDISQMKEIFDSYDSQNTGHIDLQDLIESIQENDYEPGVLEIIDVLLSLDYKGKHRVKYDQLLLMLDSKISASKSSLPQSKNSKISVKVSSYTKNKERLDSQVFNTRKYKGLGLTDEEITEIKEAFDLFDIEKTGFIETEDLKNAMETQGFAYKSPTIFKMVCELDVENKRKVDFDEFLALMTDHYIEEGSKKEAQKVFNLFDVDHTGFIELKNLKKIAKELGETLDDDDIIELITKTDKDGDGKVSFDEFYHVMSKKDN